MLKVTDNQKGNMGIALVLVLITMMSGITLSSLAFRDNHIFREQLDGVQQFHFIRSELGRGKTMALFHKTINDPTLPVVLPTRNIRHEFGSHRTVYKAKTKIFEYYSKPGMAFHIKTLISAVRGPFTSTISQNILPKKKYAEKKVSVSLSLASFHSFTEIHEGFRNEPDQATILKSNEYFGRFHSNSDIWISRDEWPVFNGLVTTAGKVKVYPGGGTNYPVEDIFKGGLIENYKEIILQSGSDVDAKGFRQPFGREQRDDMIAFVDVEGSTHEIILGEVFSQDPNEWIEGYNQFTIYDTYPPYGEIGDSIGVNLIPRTDTVWHYATGGNVVNSSIYIPMELWISGNFGGGQTWYSSKDIYLKDDITYVHTVPGQRPDGFDEKGNRTLPVNHEDYLGIISDGSIFIQYGHWNPSDTLRTRPNTRDIYLYGAFCAMSKGNYPWEDGTFTYEYQLPKGSTPAQYYDGQKYTNIDLHLFHYPTTSHQPWPEGLDYPWYNPLWPEPGKIFGIPGFDATPNPHGADTIVNLRGQVNLYGSIAQYRYGALGRSGGPGYDTGRWDIDNTINPQTPPQYGGPTPSFAATGYTKNYFYDTRFDRASPPDYPIVNIPNYAERSERWIFKSPPANF